MSCGAKCLGPGYFISYLANARLSGDKPSSFWSCRQSSESPVGEDWGRASHSVFRLHLRCVLVLKEAGLRPILWTTHV